MFECVREVRGAIEAGYEGDQYKGRDEELSHQPEERGVPVCHMYQLRPTGGVTQPVREVAIYLYFLIKKCHHVIIEHH